jgi:signal transduction histidine kinase
MRLINSLSFRLTLIYVALFGLSVLLLMGAYYWVSIQRPTEQVKAEIRRDAGLLVTLDAAQGRAALIRALERRRSGRDAPRMAFHALLNADETVVTRNLPSWPRTHGGEWLRIEADIYHEGDEVDHEALVLDQLLADGSRLLIGRDIEDIDDREEGVNAAMIWLSVLTMLLAIGGGLFMSRAIGRRVEAIGAAARTVIDGDLSRRVPVRGTGDDFDILSVTLNRMLERIEDLVESVRRVSDSVAHELRTPLVRLHADLADLQGADEGRRGALLASALAETERLRNVFDAVLRIARIEAGRHQVDLRPLDLSAILTDAIELYQPEADERGILVRADIAPGVTVTGDADLLFQAICNLLDNAIKYTAVGGAVSIDIREDGTGVIMVISDNGPGIAADLREKVFERFYRVDQTNGVPGFGLGLALVRGIAALHRSDIRLSDAEPGLRLSWRFARR